MTKVTAEEVQGQLGRRDGRITVVDARSEDDWKKAETKAGGAIRVPPDDAGQYVTAVRRDDYIVIYCT